MYATKAVGAGLVFWFAVSTQLAAQETVRFKNLMNSKISVLLKPEELASPINLQLEIDQVYEYKLVHRGQHAIEIIPHDRPNTGHFVGNFDMPLVSRKLAGQPFPLRGQFNKENLRIAVVVDLPHPVIEGLPYTIVAPRVGYDPVIPAGTAIPSPSRTSAVIAAVVPSDSKVFIDGVLTESAGELRHFLSPRLELGFKYSHTLRVEWKNKEGHECVETRDVTFRAGETSRIFFRMPIPPPSELPPPRFILLPIVPLSK